MGRSASRVVVAMDVYNYLLLTTGEPADPARGDDGHRRLAAAVLHKAAADCDQRVIRNKVEPWQEVALTWQRRRAGRPRSRWIVPSGLVSGLRFLVVGDEMLEFWCTVAGISTEGILDGARRRFGRYALFVADQGLMQIPEEKRWEIKAVVRRCGEG